MRCLLIVMQSAIWYYVALENFLCRFSFFLPWTMTILLWQPKQAAVLSHVVVVGMGRIGPVVRCIVHPRFRWIEAALGRVQVTHLVVVGRNRRRNNVIAVPKRGRKISSWHRVGLWNNRIIARLLICLEFSTRLRPFHFLSCLSVSRKKNASSNIRSCKMFSLQDSLLNVSLYYFFCCFFIKELCKAALRLCRLQAALRRIIKSIRWLQLIVTIVARLKENADRRYKYFVNVFKAFSE